MTNNLIPEKEMRKALVDEMSVDLSPILHHPAGRLFCQRINHWVESGEDVPWADFLASNLVDIFSSFLKAVEDMASLRQVLAVRDHEIQVLIREKQNINAAREAYLEQHPGKLDKKTFAGIPLVKKPTKTPQEQKIDEENRRMLAEFLENYSGKTNQNVSNMTATGAQIAARNAAIEDEIRKQHQDALRYFMETERQKKELKTFAELFSE